MAHAVGGYRDGENTTTTAEAACRFDGGSRGYVHQLFLVLLFLGLSLWGGSALLQQAVEREQASEGTTASELKAARRALLDYALTQPVRVEGVARPGLYNAYYDGASALTDYGPYREVIMPYRRFALPCPDVRGDSDRSFDGFADALERTSGYGCVRYAPDGSPIQPSETHSLLGRLPWRDYKGPGTEPGSYSFVRGVGDRDFRDGDQQRLWYIVSENVGSSEMPLNAHNLARRQDGWLTAYNAAGETLSDRVAAVVIAPGVFGGDDTGARISEASFDETPPAKVTVAGFHQAYLQETTYDALTMLGTVSVMVNNQNQESYADHIEYIAASDLTDDTGDGIARLEKPGNSIYDAIDGVGEALGVVEILEQHLHRFGYLPAPAVFDESAVQSRTRPAGIPPQQAVTVTLNYTQSVVVSATVTVAQVTVVREEIPFQRGAVIDSTMAFTVSFRGDELPPFYLLPGNRVSLFERNVIAMHPPFNAPLADLRTALNSESLTTLARHTDRRAVLEAGDHYPDPATLFGLGNSLMTVNYDNVTRLLRLSEFDGDLSVFAQPPLALALAEPAYGYFEGDTLVSLIAYVRGEDPDAIPALPPYGVKALLPAGTRLTIESTTGGGIQLFLPADTAFRARLTTDILTSDALWELTEASDQVAGARLSPGDTIRVGSLPNGWEVIAGDTGFLPVADVPVEYIAEGAVAGAAYMTLTLGARSAISDFSAPVAMYSDVALQITPFPPPGRPAATTVTTVTGVLASPMTLERRREFQFPAGTRVIYPAFSRFPIGDGFAFPDGAVAHLPPGTALNVNLPRMATLPDGHRLNNTGVLSDRLVTLWYGGFVALHDARPVLEGSEIYGPQEKIFDMEIRAESQLLGVDAGGVAVSLILAAGEVFQPYTRRRFIEPPTTPLPDGGILVSDSRVRAGFLTRPRHLVYAATAGAWEAVASPAAVTLSLWRALSAPDTETPLVVTVGARLDESTDFYLSPDFRLTVDMAATAVQLPPGTEVFDAEMLDTLSTIMVSGEYPQAFLLDETLTLTTIFDAGGAVAVTNHFALFPENDLWLINPGGMPQISVIRGGSIVDLTENKVYSPLGVQQIPRVADDLQMISEEPMFVYADAGLTLRADYFPEREVVENGGAVAVRIESPSPTVILSFARVVPGTGEVVENILAVLGTVVTPANSFIQIPPGTPLDFLSGNLNVHSGVSLADFSKLPSGAAIIIPPATTMTVVANLAGMTVALTLSGPTYLRAGDGLSRLAIVDHPSHLSGELLVFAPGGGRLIDSLPTAGGGLPDEDLRTPLYVPIPPLSRLDIYGHLEKRADRGVIADMLPLDSATLLRDFPMVYAVAPECRRPVSPGTNCAEGVGEGLTFEMSEGDSHVLTEAMETPSQGLLTASIEGVSLVVEEIADAGTGAVTMRMVDALLLDDDGRVNLGVAGAPITPDPALYSELRVAVADNNLNAELLTYFGVDSFTPAGSLLSTVSYAALNGTLTIHVGGHVGGLYSRAAAVVTVPPNTEVGFGINSLLSGADDDQRIFGPHSYAVVTINSATVTIDLGDYVALNGGDLQATTLTLSADVADLDIIGRPYYQAFANEVIGLGANRFGVSGRALTVAANAGIEMQPGYLWQGYMPAQETTLAFRGAHRAGVVESSAYPILPAQNPYHGQMNSPDSWPHARGFIRVQSTLAGLNTWGSGLERPEWMDGSSGFAVSITSLEIEPRWSYEHYTTDQPPARLSAVTLAGVDSAILVDQDAAGSEAQWDNYNNGFFNAVSGTRAAASPRVGLYAAVNVRDAATGLPATVAVSPYGEWIPAEEITFFNTPHITNTIAMASLLAVTLNPPALLTLTATYSGFSAATGVTIAVTPPGNNNRYFHYGRKNHPFGFGDIPVNSTLSGDTAAYPAAGAHDGLWVGRYQGLDLAGNPYLEDSHLTLAIDGTAVAVPFNIPHTPLGLANTTLSVSFSYPLENNEVSVLDSTVVPLGKIATGSGAGFALDNAAQISRDAYAPVTATVTMIAGLDPRSASRAFPDYNVNPELQITVASDFVFYIDPVIPGGRDLATDPPQYRYLQPRTLRFHDDFRLPRDSAIVPPFGALHPGAVSRVYAERSNLFKPFRDVTLVSVYSAMTGDCVSGANDCEAMYNNNDWLPILNGVLALGAVEVEFQQAPGDIYSEPYLVMPQPRATVLLQGGGDREIFAGSIIYPRTGLIFPAEQIPAGNYQVSLAGPAIAGVDVSPVFSPQPLGYQRRADGVLSHGVFNRPPVSVTVGTETYIVEIGSFSAADGSGQSGLHFPQSDYTAVTLPLGQSTLAYAPGAPIGDGSFVPYGIANVSPSATTATISGLTSPVTLYHGTPDTDPDSSFWRVRGYDGTFARGHLLDARAVTLMAAYYSGENVFDDTAYYEEENDYNELPNRNTDAKLGNPISYRWFHGGTHFMQLGIDRATVGDDYAPTGINAITTGDEITALRLAHRIDIPAALFTLTVSGSGEMPYPNHEDRFFRFPPGSEALVVNADAASWVSAHPYVSRYLQGLEVTLTVGGGGVVTVGVDNDGYRTITVGGLAVLHHQYSESSEGYDPVSGVPVYTNVWLRLPQGGLLRETNTGEVIRLRPGALLNPLQGTYRQPVREEVLIDAAAIKNPYATRTTVIAPLELARSALTFPAGTRVVVGSGGAELTNVKAAAIFSIAPLPVSECSDGRFHFKDGQTGTPVNINQIQEGISQNLYRPPSYPFRLSHPCAWLDEEENTDGDRTFLYRRRRIYQNPDLQARTLSNDRTFVLGGKLRLNV